MNLDQREQTVAVQNGKAYSAANLLTRPVLGTLGVVPSLRSDSPDTSSAGLCDLPKPDALALLSPREREMVMLALTGLHTKGIAYDCGIAASTVRVLLARASRKLGVRSRAALLREVARLSAQAVA